MASFSTTEKHISQIPALQLLINLGYVYLTPEKALNLRGGNINNVLLESILREQLGKINQIHCKGNSYPFSKPNIDEAIRKLKIARHDGLQKTNETIYDFITLGTSLEQVVGKDRRSFSLHYIDWENQHNNVFHVVPEYVVERTKSTKTARPDIVLFVNGIPFCVIECKAPQIEIEKAVEQNIRNQHEDYIPKLFTYTQLLMGVNKNEARYATVGSSKKFWGVWKELEDREEDVERAVNKPLSEEQKSELCSGEFASRQKLLSGSENERLVTGQDRAIYSLCRPERLLELAYRYTVFDNRCKKIARYQQFFVVRSIMSQVKHKSADNKRTGGIIWHTQGSGKSLTMVMLVRALVLGAEIANPRIILVTDRKDLDNQLGNTFQACGLSKKRASSGGNLITHIKNKVQIITTLIHKFARACASGKFSDKSPDIFVLVDESHRTNFGLLAAGMRKMLPNACYLGFTGTPLLNEEKNSFAQFGGLIEPCYSIRQAVEDKAVLPLLYEGRHTEIEQEETINILFERHTAGLTEQQKADLKRKYASIPKLHEADKVVYKRAFDISMHYRTNWQETNFKAQLVTPNKATAMKYYKYLKKLGLVTSAVVISPPDTREGYEEVNEGAAAGISKFWAKMMQEHGSEEEYTQCIINQFKDKEEPEILIVVDKLLTGFDAPRNTVLYLCRKLRGHTLLQAIARVNRLYEGKEFGYIVDYADNLGELDKALTIYDAFAGFNEEDLIGTLTSINEEVKKLPQRYSELLKIFREIKNKNDEEEYERLLADEELRKIFYECLSAYSKTLKIALGTQKFIMETDEAKLKDYKDTLKRFENLRKAVRHRYAEVTNDSEYERKIEKLLDTHLHSNNVHQLNEPTNIFNNQEFENIKKGQGIDSNMSKAALADTIAYAIKKTLNEKMEEDPAFYKKLSELIQKAIDDFKAHQLSSIDYLKKVSEIKEEMDLNKRNKRNDVPADISGNNEACAYYGVILPYFIDEQYGIEPKEGKSEAVKTALAIQRFIEKHWVVNFGLNSGAKNSAINDIDDFLHDEVNISLSGEHKDEIINRTMMIAESRRSE